MFQTGLQRNIPVQSGEMAFNHYIQMAPPLMAEGVDALLEWTEY